VDWYFCYSDQLLFGIEGERTKRLPPLIDALDDQGDGGSHRR